MRVTSDPASIVGAGITAITSAAATAILATGREATTATLLSPTLVAMGYKVGLHSSRMGGGAMLNRISIWPLSKKVQVSRTPKTQL